MAKFQVLHKYFFIFLALVVCHGSLVAHGRKINVKPLNQQHYSLNTKTVANNNPYPSLPSLKTKVESPQYEEANKLGDSGADNTNAFRSTTPGGSTGVGHKIITSSEDNKMKTMVVVQSPDVEVFVTKGSKDDFKPTDPGHSPGVGHVYQNKIGQAN
ncbi:hypothetical protein AAZX31_05G083500 [Glycine max]|uniref:Uncharacterized protein n=2 Tax=Glycine subgen. Soja TaxID=1462606 RepID=K7KP41_SOYBN|nr:precursor of CEP9 [Glycine max]XP_028230949.1 precursor of CEP9-like [Glycine soja]KAG5028695.1 hypothetical protein JHK87_012209 [Glycine soja]KAH1133502.1 hypothetical protein GYH30_012059 [Glycine max]KAH1249606.1 Precursor of CEP6 [Glycine max]KHN07861.1 hypothetical protein glysoja_044279 [Glycine soja]KRH57780.1 hypothetical protein GLYMA_05G084100v4 [Glycine max]|eukprot:XP_025984375.1 precursor of CEP9-like [Glycine max]